MDKNATPSSKTTQAETNQSPQSCSDVEQSEVTQAQMWQHLYEQTTKINDQLEKLNNHNLVVTYNSLPRFIWFSLLKGIAVGLGSVLGATVVLSALVFVLSQIEFIPVIGEWVSSIIEVVQGEVDNN